MSSMKRPRAAKIRDQDEKDQRPRLTLSDDSSDVGRHVDREVELVEALDGSHSSTTEKVRGEAEDTRVDGRLLKRHDFLLAQKTKQELLTALESSNGSKTSNTCRVMVSSAESVNR